MQDLAEQGVSENIFGGRREFSSTPALILVDSSFEPVSYNAEAVRILTYPNTAKDTRSQIDEIEARLESLLGPLRYSGRIPPAGLPSGRREYRVRMFALSNHRKAALSGERSVAHAILLERVDRKEVDLAMVGEQFRLTPRERETLSFLLKGLTSKEIANRMAISHHTVKTFLRLVMGKMQVSTRSGIIGKIVKLND